MKGQLDPVSIDRLLDGVPTAERDLIGTIQDDFDSAMEAYRKMQWTEPLETLDQVAKKHPTEPITKMDVERIKHLARSPPADAWDGVWAMTYKLVESHQRWREAQWQGIR
ncbi:MAG: hypothetical protein VX589_16950 [Myxococcota bacterium]|nr:hypothetical protein [Myxococcota bacterium]